MDASRSLALPRAPSLDPRARLAALFLASGAVLSFGKYDLLPLLPLLALPPLFLAGAAPGTTRRLAGRLLLLLPLALPVGLANPWLDPAPRPLLPGLELPGGWISLLGILCRFWILAGSALAAGLATGLAGFCRALRGLGLPGPLTQTLLFLGRYLELLLEESMRLRRARQARASGRLGWRSAAGVVGCLFLRSLDRGERIHLAMRARGYRGELPGGRRRPWRGDEWAFLAVAGGGTLGWRLLYPTLLLALGGQA